MNNNDIFKKLRVALQLRDDQIVEILELVDFRMSKGELGNIFRNEDHPNFMECGDQVLRNFLNGLVIHLRGTKENPKNAMDVLKQNKAAIQTTTSEKPSRSAGNEFKPKPSRSVGTDLKTKPYNSKDKKPAPKVQVIEKVQYKNGKNKKS
jgi:hypothetical protein